MIDVSKITYRIIATAPDGKQLDLTPVATDFGWEEGEKELSMRISMKMHNAKYGDKWLSELVTANTPVVCYAQMGKDAEPVLVAWGQVSRWTITASNPKSELSITANDMCIALRRSKDNQYFSDGTSSKSIITAVLDEWEIPYDYQGPEEEHTKKTFKANYLSDIITKTVNEAEDKNHKHYIIHSIMDEEQNEKVQIIERGQNQPVYHFDENDNAISVKHDYDASKLVTRVKIVGKDEKEGKPPVEAVIDNEKYSPDEYGVRQEIMQTGGKDKSLDDVTKDAKKLLKEKGKPEEKIPLELPDIPTVRKGDKIRVHAGDLDGFYFVLSVRHDADDRKMTLQLEEDMIGNGKEEPVSG